MKYLIILLIFIPMIAKAECCNVCPQAKTIIKYKNKVVEKKVEVPVEVIKTKVRHHSLNALIGSGPRHVEVVPDEVRLARDVVVGAQYIYTTNSGFNIGGQLLSNDTALGIVGVSF